MEIIALILLIGSVLGFRIYKHRGDVRYREREREHCQNRRSNRQLARFLENVEKLFPHIEPFLKARLESESDRMKALRAALTDVPGCAVGTTSFRLPVVLPDSVRRRHTYLVGRTGSGKTTGINHIVKYDFERDVGVVALAPETEWHRDYLLPMVPMRRARDVYYFAPGNEQNTITFNPMAIEPGDNQPRCAAELYTILTRTLGGEESFGTRMSTILSNDLRALVGRPETTLWNVVRLLEDSDYRAEVAKSLDDPNLKHFWEPGGIFDSYPKSAALPIITRLQNFLASPPIRKCLCSVEGISIRHILSSQKILLVDLGQLAPTDMIIIALCLLARIQLEIMRREAIPEEERPEVSIFADEFQVWAGVSGAAASFGELLSRGRRMACSILLSHQYPAQLPLDLRNAIFGNVATIFSYSVSGKDAAVIRKEFLQVPQEGDPPKVVPLETLISQKIGHCVARIGAGGFSFKMIGKPPMAKPNREHGERIKAISWKTHGTEIPAPTYKAPQPKKPKPLSIGWTPSKAAKAATS